MTTRTAALLATLFLGACSSPSAAVVGDATPEDSGPGDVAADAADASVDSVVPETTPDATLDGETPDGACACSFGNPKMGPPTTTLACMFGGAVPTWSEAYSDSLCGGHDVQVVTYEYPSCNRIVVRTGGYWQGKEYVFARDTRALLYVSWSDDTTVGCNAGTSSADDLSSCGDPAACAVSCEYSLEPAPPASCTRKGGSATDAGPG